MSDLISTLEAIVGERHVLADADLRAGYETDWTGRWHGESLAVVRPADTHEVSAVLRACAEHHVAVVTQGGNTGLVGGATPADRLPEIVLSMRRLDSLGDVDRALMQLPCGAGVTLARLQQAADEAGLQAGLDLAARDTATVGGLAACNAGGLQAVRYGTARRRIAGLEAVLADGTVVSRMSGLRKDNAGYDLASLLIGSEGTLGVITRVLWSLVPRFSERSLALVAVDSIGAAVEAARGLLARLPSLELLELIDEASIRLSLEHLSGPPPAPITPAWLLVGCASYGDAQEELAEALVESGLDERAVVAVDASRRQRLLSIRESLTETIAAAGVPHKLDIGVPLGGDRVVPRRAARRRRRRGAGRAHVRLRPSRRRQPARQPARAGSRGRVGRRGGAAAGGRQGRHDHRRARRRPSQAAVPVAGALGRPRSRRCGRSNARLTRSRSSILA